MYETFTPTDFKRVNFNTFRIIQKGMMNYLIRTRQ